MDDVRGDIIEFKRKGSSRAFYRIVQKYEKNVFNLCYRIIRKREEAEEASQDVFLKCYRLMHKLNDVNKFHGWILRIAYTTSIDYIRSRKTEFEVLEESQFVPIEEGPRKLAESELFEFAFSKMDDVERVILTLYYQEDMPLKEIAQLMELSLSNIKVKLHRARQKIKTHLDMTKTQKKA